ncbi:MAG: GxxExxY protein [Acidobacteria bacterium]|jgi:GxxExxY protein|nr:GxxExxY protein [Acidobacteriota bacterium]
MTPSPRTEEIATEIVDAAFLVHSTLGPGLLESVYEECLAYELAERGLKFERQLVLPITYKDQRIDGGLRLDFLVEDRIVLEVKAVEALVSVHTSQLLTYMKLGDHRLGFLINFNVSLIKNGIHRYVL